MNLRGFRVSMNPSFEGRILDFMDEIQDFMENFNIVCRKVYWQNPKLKSLNDKRVDCLLTTVKHGDRIGSHQPVTVCKKGHIGRTLEIEMFLL